VARPKNIHSTSSKTWMFYDEDIKAVLSSDKAPKDIFRLGIMALNHGWHPTQDSNKVKEMQSRISHLSLTLQSYVDKFNKLAQIVEKGLKIEVDPDVVKTSELESRLKELDEMERNLNK